MRPSFDVQAFNEPVYKKILGLAADGVVSDWYSLLGVERFESDEAKIDQAMLRRFEQARRYQVGSYEDRALRLIDELGRAYACLTNEETRRSYDKTLDRQTVSDAFTDALEAVLLNDVVEAKVVPAETPRAPVNSVETKAAKPPAPVKTTCPQCGKPTSPKAPVCYQCGHRKESALERQTKVTPDTTAVTGVSLRELARQDLSPRQLLARLQEMRKLSQARRLGMGLWVAPRRDLRTKATEVGSRCGRCGRGLEHQTDAYGIRESDVRDTLEYIQAYAKKLESLGRDQFAWPLSADDARRVRQSMAGFRPTNVALYCHSCATKFIQSPRVDS